MDQIEAGPQPIAAILADLATTFGARLRLLADTEPLARLWAVTTRRSVGVVPLPVVAPPVRDLPPGQPPHLVFAGGARVEKGYGLLPAPVRSLIDTVRFTIQSGPITAADDPLLQRAHRKLRALAPQPGANLYSASSGGAAPGPSYGVRSYGGPSYGAAASDAIPVSAALSGATFRRARPRHRARRSDFTGAALAARGSTSPCYVRPTCCCYPTTPVLTAPRSSGILAEARAMGIPAIVPAGCWLGDQVGPDPALVFNGAAGFARAVRHALERLPELQLDYVAAAAGLATNSFARRAAVAVAGRNS